MARYIDMKGVKQGKLLVLGRVATKGPRPRWRCECDCGNRITVSHQRMINKAKPKLHCGCDNKGLPTLYKVEYHAWWDMNQRCHNENHPTYPRYGAKGVTVCQRWRKSFQNFLDDMGERPGKGFSLDRINSYGNYVLENCRWADIETQARNKRNTKFVKHPKTGKQVPVGVVAEHWGFSYQKTRDILMTQGEW